MTDHHRANHITQRLARLPGSGWQATRALRRGALALAVIGILIWGYTITGQPITVIINGQPHPIRTHHLQVDTIIKELGLPLAAQDLAQPNRDATLRPGDTLTIHLARPVTIEADGQRWQILTHQQEVAAVLAAVGLTLNARDEVLVNSQLLPHDATLPATTPLPAQNALRRLFAAATPRGSASASRPEAVRLLVHRSVPVTLRDGSASSTFFTARPTVGEALLEQNIAIYLGDTVTPALGAPLTPGMTVYIKRSIPVTITADNHTIATRTHRRTVGEVLAQAGIPLMGQDYTRPALDQRLQPNQAIHVIRVQEMTEIEAEYIPFETEWIADETMEIDQRDIRQQGQTGVIKTRHRVRYENGQEVWREFEDEWLAQEPSDQVIAYGTNVVIRTLETASGPVEYWRKIPMRATAYSAATSGKDADHPRYGITSSGLPAGFGVVAVDPRVIPLRTQLYIEDYGEAVAGDTGGRILGRHIDLGYPDNEPLPTIFEWRDVYVLTPVPPPGQIRYVLPNWPQIE